MSITFLRIVSGCLAEGGLDSQSRPHITRKLRNKLGGGTSPPPTPLAANTPGAGGISSIANGPITSGPFLNPHSLSVDELPSPFPLPLTSSHLSSGANAASSKKKGKSSGKDSQSVGALGKSLTPLSALMKESEIEQDLGEIRRGNKRRRVAAGGTASKP